jgi:hypothetical protein
MICRRAVQLERYLVCACWARNTTIPRYLLNIATSVRIHIPHRKVICIFTPIHGRHALPQITCYLVKCTDHPKNTGTTSSQGQENSATTCQCGRAYATGCGSYLRLAPHNKATVVGSYLSRIGLNHYQYTVIDVAFCAHICQLTSQSQYLARGTRALLLLIALAGLFAVTLTSVATIST